MYDYGWLLNLDPVQKLLKDPNKWGTELLDDATDQLRATALKLRDEFGMSPSQKEITAEVIKKRMQIIWGPPVSIVST